jgi:rsbT co-antagonist protein RsbR
MPQGQLAEILRTNQQQILNSWIALQRQQSSSRLDLLSDAQLQQQSAELLSTLVEALAHADGASVSGAVFAPVREFLGQISGDRARRGFSPAETATFVLSLKQPIFETLRAHISHASELAEEIWTSTRVLDQLALHTTEIYQRSREEVIARQQTEMLELSTLVVMLWKGVLALPLIGTLDSERTQIVMENLLQRIVETGSVIAILDITGVPTVDTLVAQHLLKTVAAARLMGADCIISGIRPQIAQTIVHLGVDLNAVTTKSSLADAFAVALRRLGLTIERADPPQRRPAAGA